MMPGETVSDARKPFTLLVERDDKSGNLLGFVVELPRCYAYARDLASLRTKIHDSIVSAIGTDSAVDVCWV
jgi:hypothetical protein